MGRRVAWWSWMGLGALPHGAVLAAGGGELTWQKTFRAPGALQVGEKVTQLLQCKDCSCLALNDLSDVFSTGTVFAVKRISCRRLPSLCLLSLSRYSPPAAVTQGWCLPTAPGRGKGWQLRRRINFSGLSVPLAYSKEILTSVSSWLQHNVPWILVSPNMPEGRAYVLGCESRLSNCFKRSGSSWTWLCCDQLVHEPHRLASLRKETPKLFLVHSGSKTSLG